MEKKMTKITDVKIETRIIFLSAIALLVSSAAFGATYGGGTGEPNTPYLIYTPVQMNTIGTEPNDWNKCFKLMADVNMAAYTGSQYNIIGNNTIKFTGKFDGNNHKICNLTYIDTKKDYLGLFGYTNTGAEIKNLGLQDVNIVDVNVMGTDYAGGLVGYNGGGTLTNCYATGSVKGALAVYIGEPSHRIGGLVGGNEYGTLTFCHASVSVSDTNTTHGADIGGLVGWNRLGILTNCYATGSVSAYNYVGGLIGWDCENGMLTNCYASGSVIGTGSLVGGLVGAKDCTNSTFCYTNCYATGAVRGGFGSVGGLVGAAGGMLISCYATGSVRGGQQDIGGLVGSSGGTLTKCYATGSVIGTHLLGGLVGTNSGTITSCYASGSVIGTGSLVGGLIGRHYGLLLTNSFSTSTVSGTNYVGGLIGENKTTLNNCYSTGAVSGTAYVGGLIGGESYYANSISNCYSTGTVSGTNFVGGLIGYRYGTLYPITACFWDINASGMIDGVGNMDPDPNGVYGRTKVQMKQKATFTVSPYLWDFLGETANGTNDYWRMCVDGVNYPRLTWEYVQDGDFACPDGVSYDDLQWLSNDWLVTYSRELYGADANGDKKVNFLDFAILAENWLE